MKLLIFLEVASFMLIYQITLGVSSIVLRIRFIVIVLVFLVAESRLGFVLFVFYSSYRVELIKKIIVIQF